MTRLLSVGLAVVAFTAPAFGQNKQIIYDKNGAPVGTIEQDAPWTVVTQSNKMTDKIDVYLAVQSDTDIPNIVNLGTVTPTLIIRCVDDQTALGVNWGRYITTGGLDNEQPVRYRIDSKPAQDANWSISTNFQTTGLWGVAIPLILKLVAAHRFIIETTPFDSNPVQATFNITGLARVIGQVAKACGWSSRLSESLKPDDLPLNPKPTKQAAPTKQVVPDKGVCDYILKLAGLCNP